jgi:hypothetical protein
MSRADVDTMLVQANTRMDWIVEVYVTNLVIHYSDGTTQKNDATYEAATGYKFELRENGISVISKKPQESGIVRFFPFASMKYLSVSTTSIGIHLLD